MNWKRTSESGLFIQIWNEILHRHGCQVTLWNFCKFVVTLQRTLKKDGRVHVEVSQTVWRLYAKDFTHNPHPVTDEDSANLLSNQEEQRWRWKTGEYDWNWVRLYARGFTYFPHVVTDQDHINGSSLNQLVTGGHNSTSCHTNWTDIIQHSMTHWWRKTGNILNKNFKFSVAVHLTRHQA